MLSSEMIDETKKEGLIMIHELEILENGKYRNMSHFLWSL